MSTLTHSELPAYRNQPLVRSAYFKCQILKLERHRRVLDYLFRQVPDQVNVTQIYCALRMEQSEVSNILGDLRRAGYVKARRVGKKIFYTVDQEGYDRTIRAVHAFTEATARKAALA